MTTVSKCNGCRLARGKAEFPPEGGIIRLPGGWILNHYSGSEGFLGWLAMQPTKHRLAMAKLSDEEAGALGPNIKRIEKALLKAWSKSFPKDPIEKLYVAYFFESSDYHLHVHLIPRTRKVAPVLRALSKPKHDTEEKFVDAWRTSDLSSHPAFPKAYQKSYHGYCALVRGLMIELKQSLR